MRFAVRSFRKAPGLTAVAIVTLALGIGATSAIFSVVNAVLLRDLPYADPHELVVLRERSEAIDVMSLSVPDFLYWRANNDVFVRMSGHRTESFNLTGAGEPERLAGRMVSADLLTTLGIAPIAGRGFVEADDVAGAPAVTMLTHGFWQRRFGGDRQIVGDSIRLDGRAHTVIGVLPESFALLGSADVLVPLGPWMADRTEDRGSHPRLWAVARLRPGVTVEQARSAMDVVTAALADEYPESNAGVGAIVTPLEQDVVDDVRPALLLLLGAVGLVLLIACVNVANLLLTRATSRQREMALRTALGAGRGRLVRQLLGESIVLAIAGGALGMLLAAWGLDLMLRLVPGSMPASAAVGVDPIALTFTVALSVATGLLFGMAPALQVSRADIVGAIKEGGERSTAPGTPTMRNALVVAEIALALVLLAGAGLMLRSFAAVAALDPGFEPDGLVAARVALPEGSYPEHAQVLAFHTELLEGMDAAPGVDSSALSTGLPLRGASEGMVWPADRPLPRPGEVVLGVLYAVSPGYLETMRIPLMSGRGFSERDAAGAPLVCIVDERMAERFFPGEDAVGQRMILGPGAPPLEIVGVARHVRHYSLDGEPAVPYQLYVSYRQMPDGFLGGAARTMHLVARGSAPDVVATGVRQVVRRLDPELPLFDVTTMPELMRQATALRRFNTTLLALFAAAALVLAAVGLYGVIAHGVSMRAHEFGVRMALGASSGDVVRLVMRHGLALGGIGIAVGAVAAMTATGLIRGLLYGVSPIDPVTFAAVAALLLLVAALACYIPARRAIRASPIHTLQRG